MASREQPRKGFAQRILDDVTRAHSLIRIVAWDLYIHVRIRSFMKYRTVQIAVPLIGKIDVIPLFVRDTLSETNHRNLDREFVGIDFQGFIVYGFEREIYSYEIGSTEKLIYRKDIYDCADKFVRLTPDEFFTHKRLVLFKPLALERICNGVVSLMNDITIYKTHNRNES